MTPLSNRRAAGKKKIVSHGGVVIYRLGHRSGRGSGVGGDATMAVKHGTAKSRSDENMSDHLSIGGESPQARFWKMDKAGAIVGLRNAPMALSELHSNGNSNMSKQFSPVLAITLISLFAAPVTAGPFGLFKCRKAKTCPCACAAVPTAVAASAQSTRATIPPPPEAIEEYSCQAMVFYEYQGGMNISPSDYVEYIPASECPTKQSELLQQARDRMPEGATELFHMFDPDCGGVFVAARQQPSQGCLWQATYTIWCCHLPAPIKVTIAHESCSLAKAAAKAFACFIAKRDCHGIRCCRMQVRLVKPDPCCQ